MKYVSMGVGTNGGKAPLPLPPPSPSPPRLPHSHTPLFRGDPLRVVARLAFVPLNDAVFSTSSSVRAQSAFLLLSGQWQGMHAR